MSDEVPPSSAPMSGRPPPRRNRVLTRMAEIGTSAQAAIPGTYAWAITVAPAAWSRGAPVIAKIAAVIGVLALVTAPLIEGSGAAPTEPRAFGEAEATSEQRLPLMARLGSWTGPTWARVWSVWGFVLSSAIVWALAPTALSSARLDAVRGAFGMVGWALFAFASAGPVLRVDPNLAGRIVASTSLKPRSSLPRGDGVYVGVGIVLALGMQLVGWGVAAPERAVLVRLVTVVCGIAVVGGTTTIALARHAKRASATRRLKLRRALPWFVLLTLLAGAGFAIGMLR